MQTFTIYVNGKPYGGESGTPYTSTPSGHSVYEYANDGVDHLLFEGNCLEITGLRNLKSHIDKILRYAKDGYIVIDKLSIRTSVHL